MNLGESSRFTTDFIYEMKKKPEMYLPTDFIQAQGIFSKYADQMINCSENFPLRIVDDRSSQP